MTVTWLIWYIVQRDKACTAALHLRATVLQVGAWPCRAQRAVLPLRIKSYFCDLRSPLVSPSAPRAPISARFFPTPAHRFLAAHLTYRRVPLRFPLRSVLCAWPAIVSVSCDEVTQSIGADYLLRSNNNCEISLTAMMNGRTDMLVRAVTSVGVRCCVRQTKPTSTDDRHYIYSTQFISVGWSKWKRCSGAVCHFVLSPLCSCCLPFISSLSNDKWMET